MSRQKRTRSVSGCYHVMLRGNEKKDIFLDEEDKFRFIETVYRMKEGQRFYLHAFCLMDNHIHMMVSEGSEDIAKVMKRITVSYVFYFNKKYKRVGHLFQDRFKSEVVTEDGYVLSLARYIHRNPVKAGIVKHPGKYRWSSYNGYLDKSDTFSKGLDTDLVLGMLSGDKGNAVRQFIDYMNMESDAIFLDMPESDGETEEAMGERIYKQLLAERGLNSDGNEKPSEELLAELKDRTKLTIRKMAAVTGVNKDKLSKMFRRMIH